MSTHACALFSYCSFQVLKERIAALAAREAEAEPPSPDRDGERHGRQVFDVRVHNAMKGQLDNFGTAGSLQQSVALVLRSGSGVGKTYATQTARYGSLRLQEKRKKEAEQQNKPYEDCPYDLYSAYIGFNASEPLKSEEREYIQRMCPAEADPLRSDETKSIEREKLANTVAVVVLTRLLAWLAPFVASFCPEGKADRPEGENWDAVMQPQYLVADAAVAAMPYAKMHGDTTTVTRRLLLEKVEVCLRALADARKGQKPLALLIAVDEGQKLDEVAGCVPDDKGGGARWALRVLRELQRTAWLHCVALLPICTGINPEVSLLDGTDGKNVVLEEAGAVVMLPNEWRDYCEEHLGKKTQGITDRPAVHAFYALLWPRARHVAKIAKSKNTFPETQEEPLRWSYPNREREEYDPREILKAAADQTKSDCGFPQNMVRYGDVPVVDYCMFTHFTEKLKLSTFVNVAAPQASAFLQNEPLALQNVCDLARSDSVFEDFAFNVLVAFAALFYHEQPDQKHVPTHRWTKQLTNWMPEGPATFKFCGPLGPPKRRHPFTTTKEDRLSAEFNVKLEMLQKMNDAIFLHCGGGGKMDFLLVKVIAVEGTVRTLAVRFADAKHGQAPATTRRRTEFYFTELLRDITEKAREVHAGLSALLPKDYNLAAFDARHALMVTNRTLAGHGSGVLKTIPSSLERVVNPQTTHWLPLTAPLFIAESLKKVCAGI